MSVHADWFQHFGYDKWRKNRIDKLYEIMGDEFFQNSNGLEVGCGLGQVSQYLTEKSQTKMTCSEGRELFLEEIKKNNPHSKVIIHDHNELWSDEFESSYDFIIHWGLLYHLNNWEQDLNEACKRTNVLFLETVVDKDNITKYVDERIGYDQALDTKGSRQSTDEVENKLKLNGFIDIKRYDDKSLNSDNHLYDWTKIENTRNPSYRRFWIAKK